MKLKEIHRTSTFAWSPTPSLPLIATGSVAGALDESFSNESQLEIWAPDFLDKSEYDLGGEGQHGPKGVVKDSARFNRLAWGCVDASRPRGIVAAGMENGELALWDPAQILAGASQSESLILRNTTHTGPVRGLDFNPIQTNLLSSGGINGEVYIWDLKDPSKPYSPTPGARSTKLDEITSVAWNQQVQYVLAGASSTGYTVVWDLRGKREVVALAYGGGSGTLAGQAGTGSGLAVGGRRGMSDIAWHPDNATRLVTASEDDSSPIIMVWDLRNARAPEKILTGHEKGVLSLSWCKQDADLLLSCGKDNRALCWNPQTSEIIGELPSADNWAFQVDWCPRNPDLLATAFFDGTIGIHSIQSTNDSANGGAPAVPPKADGADIFDVPGFSRTTQGGTLSLKQPPKWLRRPTSASFGFGGKLVSVSNLPSVHGKNQSSVVHLRQVVTEADLVERASRLQAAIDGKTLNTFAEERSQGQVDANEGTAGWKALLSLFRADSRDELVTLLGFSKSEIAIRVAEAIEHLKTSSTLEGAGEMDVTEVTPREPVVSFVEPEPEQSENSDGERDDGTSTIEKTPSEISTSASAASDATSGTHLATDGESTTTVPSLFGDDNDNIPGTPQIDAAGDFFSTIGLGNGNGNDGEVQVPHHNYGIDSSVAATVGSRSSSVASGNTKSNHFRIYPPEESETDRLVTKALVLGDFESAVSLCLSSDRFADAILLAAKGGAELLQRTQKAYFERQTTSLPYLRLFQSIVTNDLADIVQNADLQEWQEIFVVLCTFASQEEFSGLAEQLGTRLEFQFTVSKSSENPAIVAKADEYRKNATLTYLAAGRLERLVSIWIDELAEEEKDLISEQKHLDGSRYTAHAHALQTFIEKVTVFRSAIKYVDADLSQTSNASTYKLSGLYDRYFEYADLLATQGLVKEAVAFLNLTPSDYKGSGADLSIHRDQLVKAAAATIALAPRSSSLPEATRSIPASSSSYAQYATQPQQPAAPVYQAPSQTQNASYGQPSYAPYAPAGSSTAVQPSQAPVTQQSAYSSNAGYNSYNSQASLTQPPHLRNQSQPVAAPPLAPPPKRQENGGWNDAPLMNNTRGPGALNLAKPPAITSPFPNAAPSPGFGAPPASPFMNSGQPPSSLPPPPRPGSRAAPPPPPPQSRMQAPPLPSPGMYPPQTRPPSGPPGPMAPARLMSPPNQPARQPTPGQYGSSLSRGHVSQTPPPYVRPTPPPGPPHGHSQPQGLYTQGTPPPGQPGNPGPYTSPPMQQQPGPYGPPPGSQRPGPAQPLHNAGPPAPPSGGPARSNSAAPSRAPKGPPPPKYPPGDRSHIPDSARPAYDIISEQLNRLKQTTPPSQKRLVDDLERRINPLFDALNCETLSTPVVDQLLVLTRAMAAHDRQASLAIHVDLLTRGSQTDDIGLWMSGVKQLIMRM